MNAATKPNNIALLTDSCADISSSTAIKNNIFVVPLRILCNDGEHLDGVDICSNDIYKCLENGELPKTSLPTAADITSALDRIAEAGFDGVIAVMLSGGLSGTYNLTRIIAEDRTDMFIKVFDSFSGSLGQGMILLQLAEDIQNGMTWNELVNQRVPYLIKNTIPFFSVETLEYLHKGGRIGYVSAVAGTLLQIKPIICFASDGKLKTAAKVRGHKQLIEKLIELTTNACGSHQKYNLAVANGGSPQEMEKLREKLVSELPDYKSLWAGEIGGTLSAHIGKGILGAAVQILD